MVVRIISNALSACALLIWVHAAQAAEPKFVSVQQELFNVAGSLANAWADYDGDGDPDLAVSLKGGAIYLYTNTNGRFERNGAAIGLPERGDEIRGLSWGDYDNDGDPDLLAGSSVFPTPSRSYLYRNDGGVTFVEVAGDVGLTIAGRQSRQANWIDYDNDGDLDLYAGNRTSINLLFQNTGGRFKVHAPLRAGPTDPRRTVGACWFDADEDGDLDVFLANQSGDSDAMWRNDGATFTDIATELKMDQTQRTLREGGVGCAVGDYDNDGDFDLYVATYGANLLYRNNGNGQFTDVANQLGVSDPDHTVGAAWGDYDNDGDLDLMAVGYHSVDGENVPENRLYRNDGSRFTNVLNAGGTLDVGDHGVVWVDYDGDGDLDLSVTDGYGASGGHFLLRNELDAAASLRVISVRVLDHNGHATQQGAEVRLIDVAGKLLASRLVDTGGGYNSQQALPVHFGLGGTGDVAIEVTFMGSGGREVQRVETVSPGAGKVIDVRRVMPKTGTP